VVIDDFGRLARYDCSAVLNCTVNAPHIDYPVGKALYLLGPEYFLARRRLRLMRQKTRRRKGAVQRVLVAIGGVDTSDLARLLVSILLDIAPDLSLHVVVGRSYQYVSELSSLVARFRGPSYVVIQLPDLAEELVWADMCVCGGGLTKYESAYMGVPTAVLSQNLEQAHDTVHFATKGLAFDLGLGKNNNETMVKSRLSDLIASRSLRESLSTAGLACFPEDSTRRCAKAFERIVRQWR